MGHLRLTAALAAELPTGLAAVELNPGIIGIRTLRSSFGDAAGGYLCGVELASDGVLMKPATPVTKKGERF